VLPISSYDYRVYAYNAGGSSDPSNVLSVTTPDAAPNAPSGLVATSVLSNQVDLAWADNSNNEDGYRVERSADGGGTWTQVGADLAPNVVAFSDTTVASSSSYMYRVYAFNTVGSSSFSNVITVNTPIGTPPAAPSNPVVSNQTQSSMTLAWTDNSSTEDGFTVQIATNKNFTQNFKSADVGAGVTSYQFTLLAPNTKYYLRVRAFNAAGPSAWSAVISDKTLK